MSEVALTAPVDRKRSRSWLYYLGLFFLALAVAAFVYELVIGLQGGYRMIAAGELWFKIHGSSLNLSQAVIQRYLHPAVWDPAIITVLQWPAWSIFGAIGAFLTILTGPWFRARS